MTDSARIYWPEVPLDSIDPKDASWHIFTIEQHKDQYYLIWAANPEPIIQLALKNPKVNVVKDAQGTMWTGEYLIHFINVVPLKNRVYDKIGQWF